MNFKTIGIVIAARMKEVGTSANDLGFKNKIQPSTIRKIVKGEEGYNFKTLLKVLELLDMDFIVFSKETKKAIETGKEFNENLEIQ